MTQQVHKINTPIIQNFELEYYIQNSDTIIYAHILPPHIHDSIEFYILIEGDVSFSVEQSIYKLSPGDIIISKPNEIHNCIINDTTVHKHMCFRFDPTCEFLFKTFLEKEFGKNNLISPIEEEKKEIFSICYNIDDARKRGDKQGEFIYASQLVYLLSKKTAKTEEYTQIPYNLKRILDYINVNFTTRDSIDELAEKFFISRSTLCRLFSIYLHTSPKMYLESKRLANSRILLKRGKSVLDACLESGFNDYSNYIRLFKKRFGITPKRYKEN